MSSPVAVLSVERSQSDAINLMRERNVRRTPLVEGDRLAGIVTLDDLLLDEADAALDVVLSALVRRLSPGEAKDLISQLPSLLHAGLYALPPGPDKIIGRHTIEVSLAESLGIDLPRAEKILVAIGQTIAQNISQGQMRDVRGQLPEVFREVFSARAQF